MTKLPLLFLLQLAIAIATQIEDPCQGMTVADCVLGDDNIIDRLPFDAATCESLCKLSDNCNYWRVYQNQSMEPECLHLNTNYHKVRKVGWKAQQSFLRIPKEAKVLYSSALWV